MSYSVVTEAFCIGCHVMAGFQYDAYNDGVNGVLFESLADQYEWTGRAEYGFINVRGAGVFSAFSGDDTATNVDYISVGGTAKAKIGYPSSNELVLEDYIDEWGNVSTRWSNSEPPTNIDLSESPANKVAFGQLTFSGATAGFSSNRWTHQQGGDCPVGQTQTSISISGDLASSSYSATFPLVIGELYSPWATSIDKESHSVWVTSHPPGGGTNFPWHGSNATATKTYSGSFTYSPSQYFHNA
jgi:hypothetical protein